MRVRIGHGRSLGIASVILAACSAGGASAPVAFAQQVSFGVVRPDAPTLITVEVPNPLPSNATAEEIQGVGEPFALVPGALPAGVVLGGSLEIAFVITPPGPGAQSNEMRIRFRSGDGEQREVLLALTAYVETRRVQLREASIDFGAVRIGESKTLRAYFDNVSLVSPVDVTSLGSVPAEFSALFAAATVAAGASSSIAITYTPTALGAHEFEVPITHGVGDPLPLRVTAHADTWIPEMTVDFGDVPLVNADTGWLEVDVPPHAISLSLEALGDDGTFPELMSFEGPGGHIYQESIGVGPLRWKEYQGTVFSITIPSSDAADVQLVPGGGRYRFRFAAAGTTVKVRAIVENRPDAVVDGGVLDLNIFFAPGVHLPNSAQDSRLVAILAHADEILGTAGLHIGKISYFQLANPAHNSITNSSGLDAMIKDSALAPDAHMNVFFVDVLFPNAFGVPLAGVASGISIPKRSGTPSSGVVVCRHTMFTDVYLGMVLAHEVSHGLGLYHTTENDGTHDPIEDTPECPAFVLGTDCNKNLMYWIFVDEVAPFLTAGQAHVILAHPLVDPQPSGLSGLSALAQTKPLAAGWSFGPTRDFCGTCASHR